MKTYRVFIKRYYTEVCFFDVIAETPPRAKDAAKKAAQKLLPDPRLQASDSGWLADAPVEIPHTGYSSAPFPVSLYTKEGKTEVYIPSNEVQP